MKRYGQRADRVGVSGGAEEATAEGGVGPAVLRAQAQRGAKEEAQPASGGGVGEEVRGRLGELDPVIR